MPMSRGKPSGSGFAFVPSGAALLFCALILALPVRAGTTWDGGGANASWGTLSNWNPNGLPLFNGTETITLGSGFSSGTTLTLDGSRYISSLVINTTTGFTIATGTGGTLNLRSGNITRNNVGGTEATQTISAGMVLGDPTGVAAYTGTWNLAGSNSLNITGNIGEAGGSRAINKTGAATLILSGTNTFSGGLTLSAGTVSISSNSNLGASSGGLTFNGGTLQVTGDVTGTRAITMTGAGTFDVAIGSTIEQSGVVSGNGALSLTGFGNLILSGSGSNGTGSTNIAGVLSLRGTVTLGSGNLAFNTGILELGNSNFTRALGTGVNQVNMTSGAGFAAYGADRFVNLGGTGATVTWGSGSFIAAGEPLYFGTLTADHTLDFQNGINLNGGTRSIQLLRGAGTLPEAKISGIISGTGASNLTLDGVPGYAAGSLILSNGSNSYAGTTIINAGNLLLTANATGTAGNTVLGSGTTDILLGNTSGAYDAGLFTNSAITISRNIRAQSGNTGVITLGGYSANNSTFSGNIFLGTTSGTGKGVTLTAAAGGTTTFSGVIQDPTGVSGPGLVRKSGAGTVVLSGVNTYAGGTSIDGGTLSITQSANLGANSGGVALNAGTLEIGGTFSTTRLFTLGAASSTFQIDPGFTFTITSGIAGGGALNKTGTGTMVLGGGNTYSGGTVISAGVLELGASERLLNTGAVTVAGGTLDVKTFSETVGVVTLLDGSIIGAGTLTGSEYDFEAGTVSANLAGTGALTKTTSGTVTLSGANTYTGGTTIDGGTLITNSSASLGNVSGGLVINAGTLEVATGFATARLISLGDSTSTIQVDPSQTLTVTSSISGSGALNKTGTGTMVLGGANTYSGGTVVSAGTLQISANERIANTNNLTVSGGTFDLQTFGETVANITLLNGSIAGTGTGTLTGSAFTVQSGTVSAILAGSGASMTKSTTGTVTLTGVNTFTGATTINGGTLIVASGPGGALGATSGVLVNWGGTLMLGAGNQINDAATITLAGGTFDRGNFSEGSDTAVGMGELILTASGSVLDFGNGSIGTLTFASFNPGAFSLTVSDRTGTPGVAGTGLSDRLIFNTDQTANLSSFFFNGYGAGANQIDLLNGFYEITPFSPVPEPSTYIAAVFVLATVGFRHVCRLRRSSKRS